MRGDRRHMPTARLSLDRCPAHPKHRCSFTLARSLSLALALGSAALLGAQTPDTTQPPQQQTPAPDSTQSQQQPAALPQQAPAPIERAQPDTDQNTPAPPSPQQTAPLPQPQPQQQQPDQGMQPPVQNAAPQPAAPAEPTPETNAGHHAKQASDDSDANNSAGKKDKDNDAPIRADQIHNPILWHDPGNVASLDLFHGQGGEAGMPQGPFNFISEDMNGTNPKFNARDANGTTWRVKLGNEARPEVVASRLLWATGYFVNDDYVLTAAHINNLQMKRGGKEIHDGEIREARFSRKPEGEKKIGIWEWKQNPFTGTREFNGLRVMMAVMNGWDLKDVNNAVYKEKGSDKQIFLVSDIGATFATTDFSVTKGRSKGNVKQYEKSKFITKADRMEVDFATPSAPTGLLLASMGVEAKEFAMRKGFEWIGRNVPRADARWIGSLLGQLSHDQIVDAFRAGHFPPKEIDTYVRIVEERIAELKAL